MLQFKQAKTLWRLASGMRGYLREPITLEQSSAIIKDRLRNRDQNLLLLVKKAIYENINSPYLKLLKWAGCDYGDLEQMVKKLGVEKALKKLADEGVFISIEEFKGKKEVRRGHKVFIFNERDFDNPYLVGHLETHSSGTRSSGTRTFYNLDYMVASRVVYHLQVFDAYNLFGLPFAIWHPVMPGIGAGMILNHAKAQIPINKWFAPVVKQGAKPPLKNRVATKFIVHAGRVSGINFPSPEYVALDDAWRVAEWMAGAIKQNRGCCFNAYPSLAVRICEAGKARGLDLGGGTFIVAGEPLTEAKRNAVRSVGAVIYPKFVFIEGGIVGVGCTNPSTPDDVHLLKDSLAMIQHLRKVPHADISVDAFLFTSLLPSAPKILLNVESGDWGVVETGKCVCPFEKLGFTDHIYNIRGFDKLTGEGMTFIGIDLLKIIEEVLPSKFGGGPTSYQMVEEEDQTGHTRMSVIVSPDVGAIDETVLIQTIISELSRGGEAQRGMAKLWSQRGTLRVKRIQPFVTMRGKLMPLHIHKSK